MVRFYGVGIYNLPGYVLAILAKSLPALRAEESMRLADATRAAWYDKDGYLEWLRAKELLTRPAREPEVAIIAPHHEAWFKANDLPYKLLETNEEPAE